MYIVGKYKLYLYEVWKKVEKRAFEIFCWFRSECKSILYCCRQCI